MIRRPNLLTGWEPVFPRLSSEQRQGYFETYSLHVHDSDSGRALYLGTHLLSSVNGYRQVIENQAMICGRGANETDLPKQVLKQTFPLTEFTVGAGPEPSFESGLAHWSPTRLSGRLQSRGRELEWTLDLTEASPAVFQHQNPNQLELRATSSRTLALGMDLRINGYFILDGVKTELKNARGRLGHRAGRREDLCWTFLQANQLIDESGAESDVLVEGLHSRQRWMGALSLPNPPGFFIRYRGQEFRLSGWKSWFRCRATSPNLIRWGFDVAEGEYRFHGEVESEYRQFIGLSEEDTDGSLIYRSCSLLSKLKLQVYRRGKLEASLVGDQAVFEWADRRKNPYVSMVF